MQEQRFKVCVSDGEILARDMSMEALLLFVEAFFNKYNAEDCMFICRDEQRSESEKEKKNDADDNW